MKSLQEFLDDPVRPKTIAIGLIGFFTAIASPEWHRSDLGSTVRVKRLTLLKPRKNAVLLADGSLLKPNLGPTLMSRYPGTVTPEFYFCATYFESLPPFAKACLGMEKALSTTEGLSEIQRCGKYS